MHFGMDSELAATIAQWKPENVHVPIVEWSDSNILVMKMNKYENLSSKKQVILKKGKTIFIH
mgnify:CR=1 FL=1